MNQYFDPKFSQFSYRFRKGKSAHRVMRSISRFVENRLKLKVNKQKSVVRYVGHMELLGYGIYRMRNQKFGLKVIELKVLCYGWIGYFHYANIKTRLIGLDRLLGSRLRYCIWKSWKRIRTRIRNLIELGLPEWLAVNWGFIRRGGWHVVQSPILQTTLTNERLQKRGFVPTHSIYERFSRV